MINGMRTLEFQCLLNLENMHLERLSYNVFSVDSYFCAVNTECQSTSKEDCTFVELIKFASTSYALCTEEAVASIAHL